MEGNRAGKGMGRQNKRFGVMGKKGIEGERKKWKGREDEGQKKRERRKDLSAVFLFYRV